ncbi:hypothetical protein PspLS_03585 [Pyricularia sp. CBS 133598]|nr:hypothetical protein PspLS_03585 [Pyricularia sp. CBS 133598]
MTARPLGFAKPVELGHHAHTPLDLHRGKPCCLSASFLAALLAPPGPVPAAAPPPLLLPPLAPAGPRVMSSDRPRSLQAGSFVFCVAFVMPKAACWSGTTSSSSSGLMGWWCSGTKISSAGSLSLQKSSNRSASRACRMWTCV